MYSIFTEGMQINLSKVDWEFPWNFYSSKAQTKRSLFCPFKQNGMHQSQFTLRISAYLITILREEKKLQSTRNSENFRFDGKRSRSRHDYCCRMKRVINFLAAVSDKMTCCACDAICALETRWWPIYGGPILLL